MRPRTRLLGLACSVVFVLLAFSASSRVFAQPQQACHLIVTWANGKYTASCIGPCNGPYDCSRGDYAVSGGRDYYCHCDSAATGDCDGIVTLNGEGQIIGFDCIVEIDCTETCFVNGEVWELGEGSSGDMCLCG